MVNREAGILDSFNLNFAACQSEGLLRMFVDAVILERNFEMNLKIIPEPSSPGTDSLQLTH